MPESVCTDAYTCVSVHVFLGVYERTRVPAGVPTTLSGSLHRMLGPFTTEGDSVCVCGGAAWSGGESTGYARVCNYTLGLTFGSFTRGIFTAKKTLPTPNSH